MARNPPFNSFASLLIVSQTTLVNEPDSSRDLFILEIINVAVPDPDVFLWIAAFVADAAAVNPSGIKRFLGNGLSTFLIKENPVFSNGPKILFKNPSDCPILCHSVFDNPILANEPFTKALRPLKTYVLVNNNLCRKLVSYLEFMIKFDERFKASSVPIFIPDFNLLSCELDNLHLKCYTESFYINIILKQNKIITLTVPFEKSTTVSFSSLIMENICVTPPQSRFPGKINLLYCFLIRI